MGKNGSNSALIAGISNVDAGQTKSCGLTSAGLLRCVDNGASQDLGGLVPVTGAAPETNLDVAVNRFGPVIVSLNDGGIPVTFQAGKFKAISDVTQAIDVDSGLLAIVHDKAKADGFTNVETKKLPEDIFNVYYVCRKR